jgi:pSer/pThr/pTyr-binding forkhead associated (FHA) protein
MIERAFEARTDTLATWALLQKNCLLLKAEQERSTSALSDRIRDVRQTKIDTGQLSETPRKSVIRRIQPTTDPANQPVASAGPEKSLHHTPDYLQPVSTPSVQKRPTKPLKRLSPASPLADYDSQLYWLTIKSTNRHIALPTSGQLTMGHFDPNVGIPPDIDLTFEDKDAHYLSRRHALVVGKNSQHTIEDLGSRAGVYINGKLLENEPSAFLKLGDRINLGKIELVYEKIPFRTLEAVKNPNTRHILLVTPTGRKMNLTPGRQAIIGRADPHVNFKPDVDLSVDGEVARLVSRRHALIQWKNGQPYIEDLGSGFGTRLGGELLILGQAVPLKPGDHIWLAGCVLAYDVIF